MYKNQNWLHNFLHIGPVLPTFASVPQGLINTSIKFVNIHLSSYKLMQSFESLKQQIQFLLFLVFFSFSSNFEKNHSVEARGLSKVQLFNTG